MKRQDAINQYHTEVALFEQYGAINTTTFEEWLEIKNIKLEDQLYEKDYPISTYSIDNVQVYIYKRRDDKGYVS